MACKWGNQKFGLQAQYAKKATAKDQQRYQKYMIRLRIL